MDLSAETPHLEVDDLRVGFKTYEGFKQVLDVEHLHVGYGEALGLVGESGAGKSVLALSVLRLLRTPPSQVSAQRLALGGRDLLALSEREMRKLRGRDVAMIFQDPMSSLNPVFTVGSQLLNVIRRIHHEKGERAHARALEFMSLVGLPDPENMLAKYPHQLSGGQRQRVIIALALCCDAHFIIADEPTRNLDVTVQAGILKMIANLRRELGVSLLFIANNLGLVSAMCDRVAILLDGSIVESGSVEELIRDPRHPYTHMLLRAIPSAEERQAAAALSIGESAAALPSPTQAATELCPFVHRCPELDSRCSDAGRPTLVRVNGGHEVACHTAVREEAPV